jgi:hypothetical protein
MAEKSSQPAATPSDPVAAWRQMLGEWEKSVNAMANKAMEKEDFARLMGMATGATTQAQGAVADLTKRYLETMNLPSRADLANVGERLQVIESQLYKLSQIVQSIPGVSVPAEATPPAPSRTRKPPSAAAKGGDK